MEAVARRRARSAGLRKKGETLRRGALGTRDGTAQDAERAGEAEAVWVNAVVQGGVIHHGADREMREEQAIELLDDLAGMLAAERTRVRPLVDLDLIERGLDFPPLMVGRGQSLGRERPLVHQRGDQPVFLLAGSTGCVHGVFDHPHLDPVLVATAGGR